MRARVHACAGRYTPLATLIGRMQGWYRSRNMNPVSSTCVPRVGKLAAALAAALVLAGGCDSGGGTDTGNETDANSSGTGAASDTPATSTDEPTTAADTSGSSGDEPTTGPAAVAYADIQAIWNMRCTAGCHEPNGTGQIQTGLDLTAAVSYAQTVGVVSIGAPALSRIAAGSTDDSYLWHKLKNTQLDVNGSGFQMPAGGLPQADLDTIEAWIEAGALP